MEKLKALVDRLGDEMPGYLDLDIAVAKDLISKTMDIGETALCSIERIVITPDRVCVKTNRLGVRISVEVNTWTNALRVEKHGADGSTLEWEREDEKKG